MMWEQRVCLEIHETFCSNLELAPIKRRCGDVEGSGLRVQ